MKAVAFSKKQMQVLCWWRQESNKDKTAIICDGAVRSGKTICMGTSFVSWAMGSFSDRSFAICGKTIRSIRRNLVTELLPVLKELNFSVKYKMSENLIEVSYKDRKNRFYLFGGRDEASASLIQGITLAGVLFDEAALMPRSFVEQALARCSVTGAKFWFNCNPENPQHWFYKEWIEKKSEKSALYIHFTMDDNSSLSARTKQRYKNLFSGVFYERFVEGKWVNAQGLVYPFGESLVCDVPKVSFEEYALSCDYGTVNPTSVGLWGRYDNTWYRVDEYYFASRETGVQRTDEEHYTAMMNMCKGKRIGKITVDPSAASFISVIRKHKELEVIPAKNDVLDGIRTVSNMLKSGKIKICRNCINAVKEFGLYRWSDDLSRDEPIKENDHAMDDIRYFVSTMLPQYEGSNDQIAVAITRSRTKGEYRWEY